MRFRLQRPRGFFSCQISIDQRSEKGDHILDILFAPDRRLAEFAIQRSIDRVYVLVVIRRKIVEFLHARNDDLSSCLQEHALCMGAGISDPGDQDARSEFQVPKI